MAILNQFEFKKPIRATLSNYNFWFKFDHSQSGLTQKPYPKTSMIQTHELILLINTEISRNVCYLT